MSYVLRVHQYTDSPTGHVNVEYIMNGTTQGYYGATMTGTNGWGLQGGVFNQTGESITRINNSPSTHSYVDITLSSAQFFNGLNMALYESAVTEGGLGDYNLIGKNCVDFLGKNLETVGLDKYSAGDYLTQDYSMTNAYAEMREFFMVNTYENFYNDQNIGNFASASSYSYLMECFPNVDSDSGATFLQEWGFFECMETALGESEDSEKVRERGEASFFSSPISIDLDGDGVETLSLEDSNVHYDTQRSTFGNAGCCSLIPLFNVAGYAILRTVPPYQQNNH